MLTEKRTPKQQKPHKTTSKMSALDARIGELLHALPNLPHVLQSNALRSVILPVFSMMNCA